MSTEGDYTERSTSLTVHPPSSPSPYADSPPSSTLAEADDSGSSTMSSSLPCIPGAFPNSDIGSDSITAGNAQPRQGPQLNQNPQAVVQYESPRVDDADIGAREENNNSGAVGDDSGQGSQVQEPKLPRWNDRIRFYDPGWTGDGIGYYDGWGSTGVVGPVFDQGRLGREPEPRPRDRPAQFGVPRSKNDSSQQRPSAERGGACLKGPRPEPNPIQRVPVAGPVDSGPKDTSSRPNPLGPRAPASSGRHVEAPSRPIPAQLRKPPGQPTGPRQEPPNPVHGRRLVNPDSRSPEGATGIGNRPPRVDGPRTEPRRGNSPRGEPPQAPPAPVEPRRRVTSREHEAVQGPPPPNNQVSRQDPATEPVTRPRTRAIPRRVANPVWNAVLHFTSSHWMCILVAVALVAFLITITVYALQRKVK